MVSAHRHLKTRTAAIVVAITIVAVAVAVVIGSYLTKPVSLWGTVMTKDADPRRQSPIIDVHVTAEDDKAPLDVTTDFSGLFRMTLRRGVRRGDPITLLFQRQGYEPYELKTKVSNTLYLIQMSPLDRDIDNLPPQTGTPVSNVFVRYSIESTTLVNIGAGIKTFEVENKGNVACEHNSPCSPDGKWKAAIGAASLDAGPGNIFQDARVSCIAGPCPFSKIDQDDFTHGGRNVSVSVLNWSDTVTYLFQAEVFQQQIADLVRELYPVIFGRALNFTLPAGAEGPSLEAEINNINIVFPLGPIPELSWATCNVRVEKDNSKSYRCALKPGYRFP
jgi:hypothetical protein